MADKQTRDRGGKFHVDEVVRETRRAEVVRLRINGYVYRDIAKELGINEATAYGDYSAVMERTRAVANATADDERRVSLGRIERAMRVLMPMVDAGDLDAMDRLDRLEKRRSALLGLDAPSKIEGVVAGVTLDELDEMRRAAEANGCSSSGQPKPSAESEPSS